MKNNLPDWVLILIAIVVLIGLAFFGKDEPETPNEDEPKTTKQELADRYNISRPTFKKWIKHFQWEFKLDDWNKKRFLTHSDVAIIEEKLGSDYSLVLNKGQIAERASSDYKTVSENVIKNLGKIGISLEAWNSCSCFPPIISGRILEVLG